MSTRREEIVAVATRLFATRGYGSVSFQDIADAVETSKAAINYHFRFKQDILAEIASPMLDSITSCLDSRRSLDALLAEYLDALLAHRVALQILMCDVGGVMATELGSTMWANHERLLEQLQRGRRNPASRARAAAVSGVLHSVSGWGLQDAEPGAIRESLLESCRKILAS